ncbi:MAG: N-acetyl-anhydromuranmyl-L-alanine amidase [Candidatus Heimdallarchaeota archaeon]
MIQACLFGIVDNGILVGGAIIGFSIEDMINDYLAYLMKKKSYCIKTRVKGLSGSLLGAGIGNAISDFAGGWCVSWQMAFGTLIGCMLIVILTLPIIFKVEKK